MKSFQKSQACSCEALLYPQKFTQNILKICIYINSFTIGNHKSIESSLCFLKINFHTLIMAPHGEATAITFAPRSNNNVSNSKPPRISNDNLHRTVSDISFELSKETIIDSIKALPPISEVEDAKCECCGMSEECTPEYIERIRGRFSGKWICGLCAEAVKEEMVKDGGKSREEALKAHMNACARFNNYGRAYPVLFQAEAMRELLKKNSARGLIRAKSVSPRDNKGGGGGGPSKGGITRSSSCIPAISKEMTDLTIKRN